MWQRIRTPGRGVTLEVATRLTGVLATLCVAATAATVYAVHLGPETGDGPPVSGHVVVDTSAGVRFRLPPATGWSWTGRRAFAGFRGSEGEPDLLVLGPSYFRRGWCPQEPRWSSRALVGATGPVRSHDVRAVNAAVSGGWVRAVSADTAGGVGHRRQRRRGVGWLTTAVVDTSESGRPCAPPRVRLEVISVDTRSGVATVVLLADRGVTMSLDLRAIAGIIDSVRAIGSETVDP